VITYLASPYTPHAGEPIEERVTAAAKAAARLMEQGCVVFAPIPHSHGIAEHLDDATRFDHEFWLRQDLAILAHAELLVVLRLPGWERSKGVAREIAFAKERGIPMMWMDP
jgi:hypothetical protein